MAKQEIKENWLNWALDRMTGDPTRPVRNARDTLPTPLPWPEHDAQTMRISNYLVPSNKAIILMKIYNAANIAVIAIDPAGDQTIIGMFAELGDATHMAELYMDNDGDGYTYVIQCISDEDLPETIVVTGTTF